MMSMLVLIKGLYSFTTLVGQCYPHYKFSLISSNRLTETLSMEKIKPTPKREVHDDDEDERMDNLQRTRI